MSKVRTGNASFLFSHVTAPSLLHAIDMAVICTHNQVSKQSQFLKERRIVHFLSLFDELAVYLHLFCMASNTDGFVLFSMNNIQLLPTGSALRQFGINIVSFMADGNWDSGLSKESSSSRECQKDITDKLRAIPILLSYLLFFTSNK
jgi:hypothetical protein